MADKVHEVKDFKSYTQFTFCLYDNYHVSLLNVFFSFQQRTEIHINICSSYILWGLG